MSKRQQQALLLAGGFGLLIGGHRLINAEFGNLGVPHVVGSLAIAVALRT
jgi:hypothetical protein